MPVINWIEKKYWNLSKNSRADFHSCCILSHLNTTSALIWSDNETFGARVPTQKMYANISMGDKKWVNVASNEARAKFSDFYWDDSLIVINWPWIYIKHQKRFFSSFISTVTNLVDLIENYITRSISKQIASNAVIRANIDSFFCLPKTTAERKINCTRERECYLMFWHESFMNATLKNCSMSSIYSTHLKRTRSARQRKDKAERIANTK